LATSVSPVSSRLLVLSAALLFSTGGAAIKATAFSAWQVASFRSGIAAIALFLLLPAWRRGWSRRTLLVGFFYAATLVLYVAANKLTTAANSIFLQATAPLYVLLLAPRLLGEPLRRGDPLLAALLMLGIVLFFVQVDPALATAPNPLQGNLVATASGVTWALTLLGLRWLARSETPESAGAAVISGNALAFAVCAPLAFPVSGSVPLDWAVVAYLGLFQIGLAYVAMTRGMRGTPAFEASLLLLLEPVLNSVWAWLVHSEQPGTASLLGCTLILVASLATASRARG
jgi:drug/metabolite transporter (DMT)-like permease